MILLLGANGYVGKAYCAYFEKHSIPYFPAQRSLVDFSDGDKLAELIRRIKPTFLINSAGYTGKPNVDACEIHKTECLTGNAVLPGLIRRLCEDQQIPWGHVSSGCIFTGARADGQGFTEEDAPNFTFRDNCSFYSGCKALGEEILQGASTCYIWRLRIPFNQVSSSRNYLTKLMTYPRLLAARNSLSQLDEFVRATWECWNRRIPYGIYNVTNPGSVTANEVVDLIKDSPVGARLLAQGKKFLFFASEEEFMKVAAKTPRSNCVLDSRKLAEFGITMTPVQEAVRLALANWETEA